MNVMEVSAGDIFGLQRLWEQQVVPQPVMEVSFSHLERAVSAHLAREWKYSVTRIR